MKPFDSLLIGAIFVASSAWCLAVQGLSQPAIVASIALDKDRAPVGQSPWAILTVKNLTNHDVVLHDLMIRLHVEDEKGERPMTRVQRNITHKLLPGEAPLPGVGGIWAIASGETSSHKYELSYFYDLSVPGKYTVYVDVVDPSSRQPLRTNTVRFEMVVPAQ
jgi:hypothetical protein